MPARIDAKSHWLHLFDFSPLCVLKCLLKLPASEYEKSHWLQLFPRFENVLTWWICGIFLSLQSNLKIHMVTWYITESLPLRMQSHICCIYSTSPPCFKVTLVALLWLFSTVHCQMSPQIVTLVAWKVTLVAFWKHGCILKTFFLKITLL